MSMPLTLLDDSCWGVSESAKPSIIKAKPPELAFCHIEESRTGGLESPSWMDSVILRVSELAELQFNWDGRGSAKVSQDAIQYAVILLNRTMPANARAPALVPLGHGGVQLVWSDEANEIEIEVIKPNNVLAFHLDKKTGTEREWPVTTDFSGLTELFKILPHS